MKIGELDCHCGECPIIDYCTDPFESPMLCAVCGLEDVDTGEYIKFAESVSEEDIKRKMGEYMEEGISPWDDNMHGAICDLFLEKEYSNSKEGE